MNSNTATVAVIAIIGAIIIAMAVTDNDSKKQAPADLMGSPYVTVNVQGCEYFYFQVGPTITHKGNCTNVWHHSR